MDLIDRQSAIDEIVAWTVEDRPDIEMPTDLVERINALPSAQQWTPVSKGSPKENGRYYVTRGLNACGSLWNRVYIVNYSDLMGLKSERIWWQGNVGKSDFERLDDVLAWMPLPKPYKEKG